MTRESERMAERHVQEFEARLAHVDQLMKRARGDAEGERGAEAEERLAELSRERDRLAVRLDNFRLASPQTPASEEITSAGPMGAWDALAQQIERLIEKLER